MVTSGREPSDRKPSAGRQSTAEGLAILALRAGEPVRWRSGAAGRWHVGSVSRRERDGSVGVVDGKGAARSLAVDRVYVRCRGARGRTGWEPLTDRAGRSEQLCLLDDQTWSDVQPPAPAARSR